MSHDCSLSIQVSYVVRLSSQFSRGVKHYRKKLQRGPKMTARDAFTVNVTTATRTKPAVSDHSFQSYSPGGANSLTLTLGRVREMIASSRSKLKCACFCVSSVELGRRDSRHEIHADNNAGHFDPLRHLSLPLTRKPSAQISVLVRVTVQR